MVVFNGTGAFKAGSEMERDDGEVGVILAEGGKAFLLTGEFLTMEKERKRPAGLNVGTFMPRDGFSLR